MFQLGIFLRALRPARTVLRPAQFTYACPNNHFFIQNVIAVFVFSDSRYKNAGKMLADLWPCFHRSPTRLCPDLVSVACWIAVVSNQLYWIVTEFWSFTRLGRSCSKMRPILCRSRARLCPISFAPCPFPNLDGTL